VSILKGFRGFPQLLQESSKTVPQVALQSLPFIPFSTQEGEKKIKQGKRKRKRRQHWERRR
jgi:hypothetical protein